ncbi:universal stress protein [Pseudocnuella soli]|uniref:universal stress protein n=1 Tax=Pseudocnuella soli TaxID=2502779 RepID=UPI00104F7B21|nr:universal stress protein [Pseudocnuella soli]
MTNILVPTDFTAYSLMMAEQAMKNGNYEKCNIVLFHAFQPPVSPLDMLGAGHRDPSCELMSEPFRQACKQLKDSHGSRINKIVVRCMTGSTRSVFRNFVEANDIDLIYCPEDYYFKPVHDRSVDPQFLFKKCGVPVLKSGVRKTEPVYEQPFMPSFPMAAQ